MASATIEGPSNCDCRAQLATLHPSLRKWLSQPEYRLPSPEKAGNLEKSYDDAVLQYRPPKSDVPGVAIALSIITCWALLFWLALFRIQLVPFMPASLDNKTSSSGVHAWGNGAWWQLFICAARWGYIGLVFLSLEFLYTGVRRAGHL
jgi:hypothetical protein